MQIIGVIKMSSKTYLVEMKEVYRDGILYREVWECEDHEGLDFPLRVISSERIDTKEEILEKRIIELESKIITLEEK